MAPAVTTALSAALSAKELHFSYGSDDEPTVRCVSFTLRAFRTFGVLGGNECGKTTLAKMLLGSLEPAAGEVRVCGRLLKARPGSARFIARLAVLLAVIVGGLALAWLHPAWFATALNYAYAVPLLLALLESASWLRRYLEASADAESPGWAPPAAAAAGVAYISSEHDAGQRLEPSLTIEEAIGRKIPIPRSNAGARRREVIAALRASGFQMFTESGKPTGGPETYISEGVTVGQCSGGALTAGPRARSLELAVARQAGAPAQPGLRHPGQRHLVYILSVLATRPSVLIADEMLCGLDIDRQASVLAMLQRLQARTGLAILFMSVDISPVSLMVRYSGRSRGAAEPE